MICAVAGGEYYTIKARDLFAQERVDVYNVGYSHHASMSDRFEMEIGV
jgi:hypothetical protein